MAPIGRDELEILYAAGTRLHLSGICANISTNWPNGSVQFSSLRIGWDRIEWDGIGYVGGVDREQCFIELPWTCVRALGPLKNY